jgi:CheY-like chemotaxis protein
MSEAGQLQIVLVVDDTPENIDLLSGMLNPHYRVKAATSAVIQLCVACRCANARDRRMRCPARTYS